MGQCGSCCRSCWGQTKDDEANKDEKFGSGTQNKDLSDGPVKNRRMTDILWIPVFIAAQVIYIIVTIAGCQDGNPAKLYSPRDFMGAYCGVEDNWNNGPNLGATGSLSLTMNLTSTVDLLMKQAVCSSPASEALTVGNANYGPLLSTQAERDKYLCDCCIAPCGGVCDGSLALEDFSDPTALFNSMSSKLQELTDLSKATELFSTGGANGEMFSTSAFWEEATKYFNQVCVTDCTVDYTTINGSSGIRTFTYKPPPDSDFYDIWNTLLNANTANPLVAKITELINASFTFEALPFATCPYNPEFCVPFPGVGFQELAGNSMYCTFDFAGEVIDAIGSGAAEALRAIGVMDIASSATTELGKLAGDFLSAIDAFIVISVLSFVIGIVFLVVLRFTIGICVWIAVAISVLMFVVFGALVFVMSIQCSGAGIWETGVQTSVAVVVAGTTAVSQTLTGEEVSEDCTGDCQDYRGIQKFSKNGLSCVTWDDPSRTRMSQYSSTAYPEADLEKNYCRNPYKANDTLKHDTIWCITSDELVKWEECYPIGVIIPECDDGHEIEPEEWRTILHYTSYVIWGLGGVWLIIIICMVKRINLAISLNKVAALFLARNPHVVLIPIVQALVAIIWTLLWMLSASFLLSQVPDDYTPSGYYATYAEAYGTTGTCTFWDTLTGSSDCTEAVAGACNDQWPTGSVWKDNVCEQDGDVFKCWRCSQPRYALDYRFAISFFVFLWNNAFNVAMGQILIAMCVGIWFFTKKEDKGKVSVVPQALRTIFRYHVGSVLFGSFIVALVQFIRYLMKYFEKQAEAQKNRIMVYILKCVQCCIWCFEKCIKFLNKNAYIQIALCGTNFCKSAKEAFFLIARNFLRFGAIAALSGIIHGIGFVCIMSGTAVAGYLYMQELHPDLSPFMPCVCFLFVSYVVSKLFMNVFGLAVDTSLQCFLACEEMDGCGDFVPSTLRNFVKKKIEGKGEADSD
mmetsp:Transcript_12770/g.32197  ORF Transcript_12770/g.32197 Transcript_12770/m.32197 type:complete len:969 (-) Transcript_12770:8-2914(-)